MPAALVQRELDLGERIIRTAAKRPEITEQMTSALWSQVGIQMLKSVGPDKLKLLAEQSIPPSRYADCCEAARSMYTEITRLGLPDAGMLPGSSGRRNSCVRRSQQLVKG